MSIPMAPSSEIFIDDISKKSLIFKEKTLDYMEREFLQQNFSIEERNRMEVTLVKNFNNSEYGTKGGRDTQDKIFCLSIEEAERYFRDNKKRDIGSWWWLRSPGISDYFATGVTSSGRIFWEGKFVDSKKSVRPVLWLNL